MKTVLSLAPVQRDEVSPSGITSLAPGAQRIVRQALSILEQHLRQPGVSFLSADETRDWLRLKMAGLEREEFMVLFLNNQHQLLACETLFTGTINHTEVHPREIVKAALRHNADASKADRAITSRMVNALSLVDVRVLDHFIIGDGETLSFAERGWL